MLQDARMPSLRDKLKEEEKARIEAAEKSKKAKVKVERKKPTLKGKGK